jgi:hypothetical protein
MVKIPRTHHYPLTERGRLLTAAVRATRDDDASCERLQGLSESA